MGKNTWLDLGHAGFTVLNTSQQRKLKADLANLREAHLRAQRETNYAIMKSTEVTLKAIKGVADLQLVIMSGQWELNNKLVEIDSKAGELVNHFKEKEARENFLKARYFELKDEMDLIKEFSDECPEYAIIQLEKLQDIIDYHELTPERFLVLSNMDDVDKARNLIRAIGSLHYEISNSLGD